MRMTSVRSPDFLILNEYITCVFFYFLLLLLINPDVIRKKVAIGINE